MKKYVLKECTQICSCKKAETLEEGYAVFKDENPTVIAVFENEEQALQELKKYKTSVRYYNGTPSNFYEITEFCVEIGEYDEDGDFIGDSVDYQITAFPHI